MVRSIYILDILSKQLMERNCEKYKVAKYNNFVITLLNLVLRIKYGS